MNNINLDINTYSIKELENLLKLKSDSGYTTEDVFNAKTSIVENVIKEIFNLIQEITMCPMGKGTYGSKVGRPPKFKKKKKNGKKKKK